MTIRTLLSGLALTVALAAGAYGQQMSGTNLADMKFTWLPPLPTCAKGSVASGDPTKGQSIIIAKLASGCVIAWHWHTPDEHVMMGSGVGKMEMQGSKPVTLTSGGFAMMPANHIHQFTCIKACQLFIYSNVAFDIHYVDKAGKEISPAEALKAVKEIPATEMK